jgi:hypothetical protein
MSKHGSARAVLAGAAIIVLAGCGAPTRTAPDVPGETSAGATSLATSAAPATGGATSARPTGARPTGAQQSASSAGGTQSGSASQPFAKANSIPFPVAVGNTWVYRTSAGGAAGQTTNQIVAAGPGPAGYQVTMSSTTDLAGTATATQPVYTFYPDGTIGYPVAPVNGVSVTGGAIRWPNAAGLASGRVYHSVLHVQVSQTGQVQNANVIVQGAGTTSVGVPAGTYQASVVRTTIAAQAGTIEVITWIAQGVGPVKTQVLIQAGGKTQYTSTDELLSFTARKAIVGVGS